VYTFDIYVGSSLLLVVRLCLKRPGFKKTSKRFFSFFQLLDVESSDDGDVDNAVPETSCSVSMDHRQYFCSKLGAELQDHI